MTAETIFIFVMAVILMHIKPGPGQALRIATALKEGFMPAMCIAVGVALICNLYLFLAAMGSTFISNVFHASGIYFKIAGGLYLVYLGVKGFQPAKEKPQATSITTQKTNKKKYLQYFGLGMILSLSNPIDIFFFVGILPGLIDMSVLGTINIVIFMAIFTAVTLLIDVLILTLAIQSKKAFIDGTLSQNINLIANFGLIIIGLFFIYSAFFDDDFSFNIL